MHLYVLYSLYWCFSVYDNILQCLHANCSLTEVLLVYSLYRSHCRVPRWLCFPFVRSLFRVQTCPPVCATWQRARWQVCSIVDDFFSLIVHVCEKSVYTFLYIGIRLQKAGIKVGSMSYGLFCAWNVLQENVSCRAGIGRSVFAVAIAVIPEMLCGLWPLKPSPSLQHLPPMTPAPFSG